VTDRNPSKQRRAAQNKAARQALANRTTKASQPSSVPASPSSSSGGKSGSSGRKSAPARGAGGGRARATARPTGQAGRPARTGGAPVRQPTNRLSKLVADVQAVPGGKGVFFSFLFALVAAIMLMVAKIAPQEVLHYAGATVAKFRVDHKLAVPTGLNADGVAKKPVVVYDHALAILGPVAVVFAILPIAISGVAMALALRENRRRNFTIVAFIMVLFVLWTGSLGIFFFFSAGGLVYGAFKARQAEPPPLRAARRRRGQEADEDVEDDDGDEDDDEG